MMKTKHKIFLEEFQKTDNIYKSALKAGYAESTARKLGKRILNTAVKQKAREVSELAQSKPVLTQEESKALLCDIIGIDRTLLTNTLKKIALQDKDYSSALKVLNPLAKQAIGLDITNTEDKEVNKPILNIGIIQNTNTEKEEKDGLTTTFIDGSIT